MCIFVIMNKKIRNDRPIFVGDKYKWCGTNEEKFGKNLIIVPSSRTVNRDEICEITKLKMVKGILYVRAKNLRNNTNIRLLLDDSGRRTPYCKDGNWFEFDRYFKISEFELEINKYNL